MGSRGRNDASATTSTFWASDPIAHASLSHKERSTAIALNRTGELTGIDCHIWHPTRARARGQFKMPERDGLMDRLRPARVNAIHNPRLLVKGLDTCGRSSREPLPLPRYAL